MEAEKFQSNVCKAVAKKLVSVIQSKLEGLSGADGKGVVWDSKI